jgi:ribonuclease HII
VAGVIGTETELANSQLVNITDSKKLSPSKRTACLEVIERTLVSFFCHISVTYIENYGINSAIQYGLYRISKASLNLYSDISEAVFDGNYRFKYPNNLAKEELLPLRTEIKGDSRYTGISCASIIAKVKRDELMQKAAKRFPGYSLEKHKGYGTKEHIMALRKLGPTKFHRSSYLKKIFSGSQETN